ncbi:MAG TPA: regulatory protein RecX [Actinomycetaceae bacterium]|nr:regulatory protein RecX [Actinomycetaceae bacterium]
MRSSRRRPVPEGEPAGAPATAENQEQAARAIVLRQLTITSRSREQLRVKLEQRGIPDDVSERVLDRFTEVGLIDDAAYAEMLVRTGRESRGLSRRGLAVELRKRGVDGDTAAAAIDAVDDEAEFATALRLAERKAASTIGLERAVRERRIAGMLARKGYGSSVVYRAVGEVLAADSGFRD